MSILTELIIRSVLVVALNDAIIFYELKVAICYKQKEQ